MMYLAILLIFVFFAGVAMTVNEGFWSNSILLLEIMLSGLLAVFGGVPLGQFVIAQAGASDENAWYFVFASVWGVFFLTITVMRIILDQSSQTRVKFVPPLELAAGPLMGLFAAVMFTSFAAYTLERFPLQAGAWKFDDAAGWVQSIFTYARAPFWNVIDRFAAGEGFSSPLIGP